MLSYSVPLGRGYRGKGKGPRQVLGERECAEAYESRDIYGGPMVTHDVNCQAHRQGTFCGMPPSSSAS